MDYQLEMIEEGTTEVPAGGVIRSAVDARRAIQKQRIAFGNRLSAIERGADQASPEEIAFLETMLENFAGFEESITQQISRIGKNNPIVVMMRGVKGIGPVMAAQLVAHIDIYKADTVSALWRYAGYAVIDGKRERPTKGQRLSYNKELKTLMYNIGMSFLKAKGPYSVLYYAAKERYEYEFESGMLPWNPETKTGWDPKTIKAHIHMASIRKMVKIFLSHLWEAWREYEGLPVRQPYAHEYDGHTTFIRKEDYGW